MPTKTVAIQGEAGSFSEVAADQMITGRPKVRTLESLEQVFDAVHRNKVNFGVVPIENSLVGSIHKTYDLLLEHNLQIVGETQLRIVHCLIAPKGVTFKKISKVYSHPVALDQCRNFFKKHKTVAPISYYDTAGSVRMIAKSGMENSAAIAGPHAAEAYDMKILRKSIEDEKSNYTRFILLAKKPLRFTGEAKTSIAFSMKNVPGALFKALSVFALRDIDLTRIESRPVRKRAWQYHFYIDFVGSTADEHVQRALAHLGEICHFIRILGSYRRSNGRG